VHDADEVERDILSGNFVVELNLPQYKHCFGQLTAKHLQVLGARHLPALGIADFSHQRRIMDALRRMASRGKIMKPGVVTKTKIQPPMKMKAASRTHTQTVDTEEFKDVVVYPDSCSESFKRFERAFEPLAEQTKRGRMLRAEQWKAADANGSGSCSLSEIDAWIKTMLVNTRGRINGVNMARLQSFRDSKSQTGMTEEDRIWNLFKPCYKRAFNDASDVLGHADQRNDGLIQKGEFRLLCAYLCIYARMYDAFFCCQSNSSVGIPTDSKDVDKKITVGEWQAGYATVRGHGFLGLRQATSAASADILFARIDKGGGGSILLSEWCAFLKQVEQKHGTELGCLLSAGD
jgi:hypothetical protein